MDEQTPASENPLITQNEETEASSQPQENFTDPAPQEIVDEELKAYAAALRAEFLETQAEQDAARVKDAEKATRDFFRKHAEDAALQIVFLAHNSDSDSIRLRASQFILNEAFAEGRAEGDPIKELIDSLTAKPAPESTPDNPQPERPTYDLNRFRNRPIKDNPQA